MPDKLKITKILDKLFDDSSYSEIYPGFGNVTSAYGYVKGSPALAYILDGVMDMNSSEKICTALDFAAKSGMPVIAVYSSNGAYIDDGAAVFAYYGKILKKVSETSGVIPQIALTDGVCTGSLAVIAASADLFIATKSAEIYTAPGNDTEVTDGAVALFTENMEESLEITANLLEKLPLNNLSPLPEFEAEAPEGLPVGDTSAVIAALAEKDSIITLFENTGKASKTAFGTVNGALCGFVGVGKDGVLIECEDCSKIAKFVNICDAYSIPVVTVLDTDGFSKSACLKAAVKLSSAYANASTRKITLISGRVYGSALSVFVSANADAVYAYENAVIAPLAPLSAVEFLHHDKLKGATDLTVKRNELAEEYKTEMSAKNALSSGIITALLTPETAYKTIASALDITFGKRTPHGFDRKHNAQ
jgi:acetyl-CoA carboxylase carboxyltransferase component